MLTKLNENKRLEFTANELKDFTLKNPLHKLWREFYIDEFRKLRSEAGFMQVLLRLRNLNQSSLGILVYYTFDQMKKQSDDDRGKRMVDTLKDSNSRNKASTTKQKCLLVLTKKIFFTVANSRASSRFATKLLFQFIC